LTSASSAQLSWAGLSALIDQLAAWDAAAMDFSADVRWQPLTLLFLVASAWWVKWPLFAVVGALGDGWRRPRIPVAATAALVAVGAAALVVTILKNTAERARPPIADPGLDPIGAIPASTSFPSGHAATAFAAAVAVGLLCPRLRRPLLALAALVALSRVYLGVHYVSDVLVGSALGAGIGFATAWFARSVREAPIGREVSPGRL